MSSGAVGRFSRLRHRSSTSIATNMATLLGMCTAGSMGSVSPVATKLSGKDRIVKDDHSGSSTVRRTSKRSLADAGGCLAKARGGSKLQRSSVSLGESVVSIPSCYHLSTGVCGFWIRCLRDCSSSDSAPTVLSSRRNFDGSCVWTDTRRVVTL